MTASPQCPKCSAIRPADAPRGLCPCCLLGAALADPDEEHVWSRATGAVGGVLDLALDRATSVPASDNDRVVSGVLRVVERPDFEAPGVDAGASPPGRGWRSGRSTARRNARSARGNMTTTWGSKTNTCYFSQSFLYSRCRRQ